MRQGEIERLRKGMMCCIEANQSHMCPKDCPYEDEVTAGHITYCEGVMLQDARRYIMELERHVRIIDGAKGGLNHG